MTKPVLGVAVVLLNEQDPNQILLGCRAKEDGKGRWVLPGGRVDDGETPEQAIHREIREELGAGVREVLPIYHALNVQPTYTALMLYYVAAVKPQAFDFCTREFSCVQFFDRQQFAIPWAKHQGPFARPQMWANDYEAVRMAMLVDSRLRGMQQ